MRLFRLRTESPFVVAGMVPATSVKSAKPGFERKIRFGMDAGNGFPVTIMNGGYTFVRMDYGPSKMRNCGPTVIAT